MRYININTKKFSIPQTCSDLTIRDFLEIRKIEQHFKDDEDAYECNKAIISHLTKMTDDDFREISVDELAAIMTDVINIQEESKNLPLVENPVIKIDGITYVLETDNAKHIYGQYIDLKKLASKGDLWDNMHYVAASYFRPAKMKNKLKYICGVKGTHKDYEVSKYEYNRMERTAERFLDKLPIVYANTAMVFFLTYATSFAQTMKDSSHNTRK